MRSWLALAAVLAGCGRSDTETLKLAPMVSHAPDVRVMSYNIRLATAPDGENHWERRKGFLVDTVKAFDPDLLGTQETLGVQRDYLAKALPGHQVFGVGREDGQQRGEMMAIYWRKERFEKLDGGHFWLSESPDRPGHRGWDAAYPRMATWVKLRDRERPETRPLIWVNTHLDNKGSQARVEGAKLIRRHLEKFVDCCSLIVTGDFNTGEDTEPYQVVFGHSPLVDTFRLAHPNRTADEGTFTGFVTTFTTGSRIDWIGCSRDWAVRDAAIDRTSRDQRMPSDHFAVTAVLRR